MRRHVQPEILDTLDPDSAAARASRRDLVRINRLMGNYRWIGRVLKRIPVRGQMSELGAGDGSLGHFLIRTGVVSGQEPQYAGVDRIGEPPDWPASWAWHQIDLREFDFNGAGRILIANLILHQFADPDLHAIGSAIRASNLDFLVLNEPRRNRRFVWLMTLSRLIGMHPVTLHDARVSIEAGFRSRELADLLGLRDAGWEIRVSESLLGANRLTCQRR